MSNQLRRWQVRSTVAILVLATVSAVLGLFRPGHYRDAPALVDLYRVQDLTILVVGVPILAIGLWYARRGSPRGRVVWLGGLAYMTYMWVNVGIQVSFNDLFLVYVALFGLSLFTFVGGVATTDADAVREALDGRIRPSVYAGSLALVGLGLGALWLSDLAPAVLGGTAPLVVEEVGPQAVVTHFVDLGVVVPAILLSAVWLARRRTWGYVFAGVVLVLGATLAAPISVMTLVLLAGDTVTVSPVAALLTFLPVVVAAVLAVTYVRSMDETRRSPTSRERRPSA
jgi:hypothetical protein